MSACGTQERWEQFWTRIDRETKAQKNSQAALYELSRHYLSLPIAERVAIDAVLGEWLLRDSADKRYDALFLIREHRIRSALPALMELRQKLDNSQEPSARFEKAAVVRVVATLR